MSKLIVEKQEKWRREKGGANARAVEIKMWSSKSKRKEDERRKVVFKEWNESDVKG